MDLALWLPLTIALGLAVLGGLFAFIHACDKV